MNSSRSNTIVSQFIARCNRHPNAPAIEYQAQSLTYCQLRQMVEEYASMLIAGGLRPGARVGIFLNRTPDAIAAMLGALTAAGVYVPLDPRAPATRNQLVLDDAALSFVVTSPDLFGTLPNTGATILTGRQWEQVGEIDWYSASVAGSRLCYILYTSGSTGIPKGVVVREQSILRLFNWLHGCIEFGDGKSILATTTFTFDISVIELLFPLLNGGRVLLADDGTVHDSQLLNRMLSDQRPDYIQATPTAYRMLLNANWPGDPELTLLCGGEALDRALADDLLRRGRVLWNLYGPTETTVWSTASRIDQAPKTVTIGRPIHGTRVYVLNSTLRPVPIGVAGELYIGGDGLALGYLNRSAATAGQFVPDPFSGFPGARLFKTGDRVRWLPERQLEFIGRLDSQLKIRGFRIETGEVEHAINQHPSVAQCAVTPVEQQGQPTHLAAYLVAKNGHELRSQQIAEFVKTLIPSYMLPTSWIVLDELPTTPGGKVDRKALPLAGASSQPRSDAGYVAPQTALENRLVAIWQQVLEIETIGIEDNFFLIGGSSLSAARILSRVRNQMHQELPLAQLLAEPTIARLARLIEAGQSISVAQLPEIPQVDRSGRLPLSFAQERLWFLCQLTPENPFYNVPVAVRVSGALDITALRHTLHAIVQRHESLRTSFTQSQGQPFQRIHSDLTIDFSIHDLTHLSALEQGDQIAYQAAQEATTPFDLSCPPLARARLIRLAPREHVFILNVHHIVTDGWSMRVLATELAMFYMAALQDEPVDLPPLSVQYADYAAWEREVMEQGEFQQQLKNWTSRLDRMPMLQLPFDKPRPTVMTYRGDRVVQPCSADLSESVRQFCAARGLTPQMLFLASFKSLLHRYTGQTDLVVGMPTANRTRPEIEPLIGFFVNTLAIRTQLKGDDSFHDALHKVRTNVLEALSEQSVPFERVVEALQPERSLSHNPLVQVMLAVEELREPPGKNSDLTFQFLEPPLRATRFDLEIHIWDTAAGFTLEVYFSSDLFEKATVASLVRHWTCLLSTALVDPDCPIRRLPLTTSEERRELQNRWIGKSLDSPTQSLLTRFESMVNRAPELAAVRDEDMSIDYRDLNLRAEQLAAEIGARAEVHGKPVAILFDRSVEWIIAQLAVLKAHAGFLALDPAWPSARLESAISESCTPIVLTSSSLARRIPERFSKLIVDEPGEGAFPLGDFPRPVVAETPISERVAYYIFTSGSSGGSKAVCGRESALINLLDNLQSVAPVAPGNQCAAWTSVGFDVAVYEVFSALCYGATLNLVPAAIRSEGVELGKWLRAQRIDSAYLPPFALAEFATWLEAEAVDLPLRRLLVGVEPIRESLLARIEERIPDLRIINGYGPSEASVCSTFFYPDKFLQSDSPAPIGKPLPGVRLQILDAQLDVVPVGIVGELYIAGAGLGQGYLKRPRLTAQRFVPALNGPAGCVAFKTGDLVRSRGNGQLEFVGRADAQVKINGARVEPGEVESVLLSCTGVNEVAVVAQDAGNSQRRLAAFVVPGKGVSLMSVADWRETFAATYAGDEEPEDPRFNIVGWNSVLDDSPIPADIMRELVQGTVERIRSLGPGRVLEIGFGTGLVMYALAPAAKEYWATDFSPEALKLVRDSSQQLDPTPRLVCQEAADFSGLPRGAFDTVVINSVIQYFPDEEYLFRVLQGAVDAATIGGRVFIGDVRSLALLSLLHYSIGQLRYPDESPSELIARAEESVQREEELIVDPRYFLKLRQRLPRISHVMVEPKRGSHSNELTRYRYDVVLELDGPVLSEAPAEQQTWRPGMTIDSLRSWLQQTAPISAIITNVPNARTSAIANVFYRDCTSANNWIDASPTESQALDPEDLWKLAETLPYRVHLDWSTADSKGAFHACFTHRDDPTRLLPALDCDFPQTSQLISSPKLAVARRTMLPRLRAYVDRHLPTYMRPTAYAILASLPRTANGKVDRSALATQPVSTWKSRPNEEPPQSAMERELAALWSSVLGLQGVSRKDNFFELGGHSLTAAQVIARLRQRFSVHLPLARVFEKPVLADFAELLSEALATQTDEKLDTEISHTGSKSIPELDGPSRASVAQEQLWFLQQLDPDSTAYHMQAECWIEGPLNIEALQAAYSELQQRHAALRTVFSASELGVVQIVDPHPRAVLEYADLSDLASHEAKSRALTLGSQVALRPFDLQQGPLHRACVYRVGVELHLCVVCVHHIIADGWSAGVAARDLFEYYFARHEARPPFLPALQTSYTDLAALQRQRLEAGELDKQCDYWRRQLSGAPEVLELPTDHPGGSGGGVQAARIPLHISAELTGRLRAIVARKNATLFMMMSAAIQCMLSRCSGQQVVCLGVPVAGRSEPNSENIVGLFTNLLVLKSDLRTAPTFDALLSQVRTTTLEAFANQDLPFERVVRAISPTRLPGRQLLVQAVLSMQNFPQTSFDFGDLKLTPVELPDTAAKFDLTFSIGEFQEGLAGWLEYRSDLFDHSTGQRLMKWLGHILEAVAANPMTRIDEIPLGSPSSRHTPSAPDFRECRIEQLFEEQVKRTPHAVAVGQQHVVWTYTQLHHRSQQYAAQLRFQGVTAGDHVAIVMRRSPELLATILGILQAGGAYVPLEPSHPADYLKKQIEDASVDFAIVDEASDNLLPPSVRQIYLTESINDPVPDTFELASCPSSANSASIAYVMYTSGSTGRPKAVAIPHRAVVRLVSGCHYSPICNQDVVLGLAPTGFDASTFEIWATLLQGARLELFPADELVEGASLARIIDEQQVTILWLTAGLFHELVQQAPIPFQAVRMLLTGGDVVLPEDVARVFERTSIERVVNGYGPTENTTFTCCHIMDSRPNGTRVPIGAPIPGTTVHVLDRRMRICPIGIAGELYAGGIGLARGYYRRSRLTAAHFVPDPFTDQPGQRLYRTGDRVSMRDDGLLDFLGRFDRQVKVRGFRIEPSEVEAVLLSHPEVTSAAVFDEGDASQRQLVGAVVTERAELKVDTLREYLVSQLPDYAVPSRWIIVDQFPLTNQGKVDRQALLSTLSSRPALNELYVSPRNAREALLADLLAQLLQLDRVGVNDNFFDIGGHSLLATRVLLRLRQQFNVDLPLRELFAEPTVAGLARLIDRADASNALEEIPTVPRDGGLPLSPAQDRIWFLQQLAPQSPFFNIPLSVRIVGPIDIDRLCEAARQLVARHEALHTRFEDHQGTPRQHIEKDVNFQPQVIDLRSHSSANAEASQIQLRLARRPFQLGSEIPVRCTLIQIADGETWAVLNFHHIAVDGWSLWILLSELRVLYEFQPCDGAASAVLPALPVQYADFAVWQRERMNSPHITEQLEYWRRQLSDAPRVLRLPADYPPPAVQRFVGDQHQFSIPEATWAGVLELARTQGTTPYVVALAAYQALLVRHTGQEDLCIGVAVAGRTHPATESLVGCFANTLVLRSRAFGNQRFIDHLHLTHQTVLDAHANQDLAFERLLHELHPDRDLSTTPLFQVMFGLERSPVKVSSQQSLHYELLSTPTGTTKCDMSLLLTEYDGRVSGVMEYNTDLFDRATIVRLGERFVTFLDGIPDHQGHAIGHWPLLTKEDHEQLRCFAEPATRYNTAETIDQLFAQQAARTPMATALIHHDQRVSYYELAQTVACLTYDLRERGICPGDRVGTLLPRGPQYVASVLAILGLGAICVPLDIDNPESRIESFLHSSKARFIVTEASQKEAWNHVCKVVPPAIITSVDLNAPIPKHRSQAQLDDGAFMIYTSGSTGIPKGVLVTHRCIANRFQAEMYHPDDNDVWAATTGLTAIDSIWEMLMPLISGRCTVLVDTEVVRDPWALIDLFATQRVTRTVMVPSLLRVVLDACPNLAQRLPILRYWYLGGEAMPVDLHDRFLEAHPQAVLINGYGLSETWDVSAWQCTRQSLGDTVPVGRPFHNVSVKLLDPWLAQVPPGVAGEIHVGGEGLAKCYFGQPRLTACRFIPNERGPAGSRLFRSGDLGKIGWDGLLRHSGRVDQQIKIRGFRVEPGEVEAALVGLEKVDDAVVVAIAVGKTTQLVAHVVVCDSWLADSSAKSLAKLGAELKHELSCRLPAYLVPRAVVVWDTFPRLSNGKLDRSKLNSRPLAIDEPSSPPKTETELTLSAIWGQLLQVGNAGRESNFFALGGDSLTAMQLVARVRECFGVELSLIELFAAPQLSQAASMIDELRQSGSRSGIPAVLSTKRPERIPLSPSQHRLWFLCHLVPSSPVFNLAAAIDLLGSLDIVALKDTCHEVVRRHESLRTRYVVDAVGPRQEILPDPTSIEIPIIEWSDSPTGLEEQLSADAVVPFELAAAPPLRVKLYRISDQHHVLLLVAHHIALDGWSLGVLVAELAALYEAYRAGRPSALPEPTLQYADYVIWQQRRLDAPEVESQLLYWRKRLENTSVLELPTDRPRPAVMETVGTTQTFYINGQVWGCLKEVARAFEVTPFAALMAAVQVVLSRLAGQTDICVGTPTAGRPRRELEPLIGLFVNTLTIRGDLSGDPTFDQFMRQIQTRVLQAFEHQEVPFQRVVEELNPPRDLSRPPLFQVMLVLQNAPLPKVELPGTKMALRRVDVRSSALDLTIYAVDGQGEGATLGWEYRSALFDSSTIQRMHARLVALLESIVHDPRQPLSRLEWTDSGEVDAILETSRGLSTDWRRMPCLHELFAAQVDRTPTTVAVLEGEVATTYAQLDAKANQLAHAVIECGVRVGDRVALCLQRSRDMVVAILAILKAGASYVPLSPLDPDLRNEVMLEAANVRLQVTHAPTRYVVKGVGARLDLDANAAWIAQQSVTRPVTAVTPLSPAYIIFTSGSSGRPKGVVVPHRGVSNRLSWAMATSDTSLGPSDRVLLKTPYTFDVSVAEIFEALVCGASLVIAETDGERDPHYLAEIIQRRKITVLHFVPSMLRAFLGFVGASALQNVRRIACAGEALSAELARECIAHWDGNLQNLYGPTEASIEVTYYRVDATDSLNSVPIGRPIANVEVYVIDHHLKLCPIGAPGELFIGGPALASGYLGQPGLTAASFIPHPLSEIPGSRLYRTGDRGRYRVDRELEYLGRLDRQAKVRGFRIELEEVESVVAMHSQVDGAAVVADVDSSGDRRLVAYVAGEVSHVALQTFLAERLPPYMLPSVIQFLPELPLTPSGKIDRGNLPAPRSSCAASDEDQPITDTERAAAGIWRDILQVENARLSDNFFEVGGHSLSAYRLIAAVQQRLGVTIPIPQFFLKPTLRGLSQNISEAEPSRLCNIPHRSRLLPIPASLQQQQMLTIQELNPGNNAYNLAFAARVRGRINFDAMRYALKQLMMRHEVLRTRFYLAEGQWWQQITEGEEPFLEINADRFSLSDEWAAKEYLRTQALASFDLRRGPVFRVYLIALSPEDFRITIVVHHAVVDDWSMELIARELSVLYPCALLGESSPLSPLPIQYADYAAWQRARLSDSEFERQLQFWAAHLRGAPASIDLHGQVRPSVPSNRSRVFEATLDGVESGAVNSLAASTGSSAFIVLMASFQALVSRYLGQQDFCIGTLLSGRHIAETQPLVGYFLNTQAWRANLRGNPSFAELIERCRQTSQNAHANSGIPYEALADRLNAEVAPGRPPFLDILFTMVPAALQPVSVPGLEIQPEPMELSQARLDLVVLVQPTDSGYRIRWEYRQDLYDERRVRQLHTSLEQLFRSALEAPHARVSQLRLLPQSVRHLVLGDWSGIAAESISASPIPNEFEHWVRETPDAIAITFGTLQWSYSELNQWSNRIANQLLLQQIEPGSRVAVLAGCVPERVAAFLALLKIRAVYVPLEPTHPPERLRTIVSEVTPEIILTPLKNSQLARELSRQVLVIDATAPGCDELEWNCTAVRPRDLAYLIYTSGSTGKPKGVVVDVGNLSNLVGAAKQLVPGGHLERIAAIAPSTFDASIWEMMLALTTGATLCVFPDELPFGRLLSQFLEKQSITQCTLTPTALGSLPEADFPELGTIIVAGEACPQKTALAWSRSRRVVNAYGPTEATICATLGDQVQPTRFPIGQPIPGQTVYVLDGSLEPVPIDVQGELIIGGRGVACGYWKRPRQTAISFLPDPYSVQPGSRMYRTGDRARWMSDGKLEFVDRLDRQVKIRGVRIEPAEIESALQRHPCVHSALVLAQADQSSGESTLVAYIRPMSQHKDLTADLRASLTDILPSQMIPSVFQIVDEFPRTQHGKLDRGGRSFTSDSPLPAVDPPRGELETKLARIWSQTLKRQPLGRNEDFFDAGGHSLAAANLLAQVAKEFALEFSFGQLITHPTVAEFARLLENAELVPERRVMPFSAVKPAAATLVLVHPAGGSLACYRELINAMSADHTIYGVQSFVTDAPCEDLDEVVVPAADQIQALQPIGPIYLCGWSTGGIFAHALAAELIRRGACIPWLGMIDTRPAHDLPTGEALRGVQCAAFVSGLLEMSVGSSHDVSGMMQLPVEEQLEQLRRRLHRGETYVPSFQELEQRFTLFATHLDALATYRPSVLVPRIDILRTDPYAIDWLDQFGRELTATEMDGGHYGVIRHPQVAKLAALLKQCMGDLQR